MSRVFAVIAGFWVAACAPTGVPLELDGLWSRSEAACRFGAGVRFGADDVRVFYGRSDEVLLAAPRYSVERRNAATRVTIWYRSPRDQLSAPQRKLILERDADDGLRSVSHGFADGSTGAVRVDLGGEDLRGAMTLRRCRDIAS